MIRVVAETGKVPDEKGNFYKITLSISVACLRLIGVHM
jgi:hypothetical protein